MDSHRISRVPWYLGTPKESTLFCIRGYHPLWLYFPENFAIKSICNSYKGAPQPRSQKTAVWAVPISLAATLGITVVFFSWGYLDGSVHPVSSTRPMYSAGSDTALPVPGCPIRKSPDRQLFAPNRSLSQLTTSFIASLCQGIPHAPLIT